MKKIIISFAILFLMFVLTACDYPEKSFQALDRTTIPTEVTRDFTLERGVYAPFVWTSDNDAIIIEENKAIVNQKEEDTVVTITATINKTSEKFEILVLKIGSGKTLREKSEDAIININEMYTEINSQILIIPKKYDDLYLKFYLNIHLGQYGYYEDEDNIYLSSGFNANNNLIFITVSFYKDNNFNNDNYIWSGTLELLAKKLNEDDLYLKTLKEVNINNYHKTFKFDLYLNIDEYIEFKEHDTYNVKLEITESDNIKKINNTKYQLIKPITDKSYIKGYLTITIDNMPKKILITIHSK